MEDLALFYPENHHLHAFPDHPERPERVEAIRQSLEAAGLWDSRWLIEPADIPEVVLHSIHTPDHTRRVQFASQRLLEDRLYS